MSGQAAAESWPTSVKIIWGKNNHLKKQVEAVSAHQRCQTIGWEAGSLIFQKDVKAPTPTPPGFSHQPCRDGITQWKNTLLEPWVIKR